MASKLAIALTSLTFSALAGACVPAAVVGPNVPESPDSAHRIVSALGAGGVNCEVKEQYAHCNVGGNDVVLIVTLAATGRQLTMMVPLAQPACAAPAFHERIARYNHDYFMVAAACLNEKTLILSHRTHLFRIGLDRRDLQEIVEKWVDMAVGSASSEGLLGPVETREPTSKPEAAGSKV